MRIEGDNHENVVVEEELEVSLWRLIRRFSHSETVLIPLPGYD
jgi:hypothetical protein